MTSASARRPYRSRVREDQANRTRAAIVDAARALFVERGWAGTSVRAVARAAGVAEATVYATFGSKAALAVALIDAADELAGPETTLAALEAAGGDPAAQLRAFVAFDRRLFDAGGALVGIVVDGRRDSPELAAAYADGRGRGDRVRREVFSSWPAHAWRDGVDVDIALDVFAGLCTLEGFRVLRDERGWTADAVEEWWAEMLCRTLLTDGARAGDGSAHRPPS
ncbi:TetR/AcrR family transcriptional regulator [Pseudonocardia sp.]|uniref:TetR/AcrR family transcriptional regulator n=1 Tax=Pseudonocardia sp. TaxID=60912 RepID=UPI003D0B7839